MTVREFSLPAAMRGAHIQAIAQDSDGFIWIGSWNGLFRFDGREFEPFRPLPTDGVTLDNNRIEYVRPDSATGLIRIRNYTHRVYSLDPATRTFRREAADDTARFFGGPGMRRPNAALASFRIDSAPWLVDRDGNIWMARFDKLLFVSPGLPGVRFIRLPGVERRGVNALYAAPDSSLWVGCRSGRIRRIGADGKILYLRADGTLTADSTAVYGPAPYAFHQDESRRIWIGTKSGVLDILTPQTDTKYKIRRLRRGIDLEFTDIYGFTPDSEGYLWAAGFGRGPMRIEGGAAGEIRLREFTTLREAPANRVRRLACSPSGLMFAATTMGVAAFDPAESLSGESPRRTLLLPQGSGRDDGSRVLLNADVLDVMVAPSGRVYISQYTGGVQTAVSDSVLLSEYPDLIVLPGEGNRVEMALSAITDRSGRIWLVSAAGLRLLDESGHTEVAVTPENACRDFLMTEAAPQMLADGRLAFGTGDGVILVDPTELDSPPVSKPVVTAVERHGTNAATISFTALCYEAPEAIKYSYRQEGSDEWIDLGERKTLHLTNLAPGDNVVHLRASDALGRWQQQSTAVTVEIPYTWRNVAAIVAIWICPLILAGLALARLHTARVRRRRRKVFEGVVARTIDREHTATFSDAMLEGLSEQCSQLYVDSGLRVERIAGALGLSRGELRKQFRRLTGKSVEEYLRAVRIEAARRLLTDGRHNVAETSRLCGFSSPQYMAMVFKESTGMTPGEFAKKM